ncbi:MAG: hypothetical protein AB7J35_05925 [Dehalococcoidia bacterium]
MKRRWFLSSVLALSGASTALLTGLGFASAANTGTSIPFSVTCTSTGQDCDQFYSQSVTTSSVLILEFQSDYRECGDYSVTFVVDGVTVYTSPVLVPFGTTGPIDLGPVSYGPHEIQVHATGVVGGCNTGTLTSWAGRLNFNSTDDPPPDPTPPQDDPPAPPADNPTPPGDTEGGIAPGDCKHDGWRAFETRVFRNQGDCVSDGHNNANHDKEQCGPRDKDDSRTQFGNGPRGKSFAPVVAFRKDNHRRR